MVWRFSPAVAARAELYELHSTQRMQRERDGSLTVRFKAAGSLEMHRHLAIWGSEVSVMAPPQERFERMAAEQHKLWSAYFS